jgi:erythronate-4-phosphate dehydrogenase
MKTIADENIPYVRDAFGLLGSVQTVPAKAITQETVKDADCLLVRSVTKVNEQLLSGSTVKYVATATIGVDHIDQAYLASRGIIFASAPGSNANSVAEWVVAALLRLDREEGIGFSGKTIGIVGVGNVGKIVEAKARALGMKVLLNDPPRQRREGATGFIPLPELLAASDFVTTHVPLINDGEDKTLRMAEASFFAQMKPGAVYLNASRGKVVDEASLLAALRDSRIAEAVLDVWENEPGISPATLAKAFIGTPHIAGYSFDGKVAGTRMIYAAACEALGAEMPWDPAGLLPPPEVPLIEIDATGRADEDILAEIVGQVYDIRADDAALRKLLTLPHAEQGNWFTRLRKEYPRRREFRHTVVRLANATAGLRGKIAGLGFATTEKRIG